MQQTLETMWLLKQFVIPTAGRADLDNLAAAHVLLSSTSRPERRRMLGLRVAVLHRHIDGVWIRRTSIVAMSIATRGLRYSS